ncbi:MAG: DNA recombination protein RmuC [bacterium]
MTEALLGAVLVAITILIIVVVRFMKPSQLQAPDIDSMTLFKQDLQGMQQTLSQAQAQLGERMDLSNQAMQANVHAQMRQSADIIKDVTERLTKLDETNRRVVDITSELKSLQNVLQNPKQRGVLGEFYLAQVLENVLPPDQFQMQYKFKDGEIVDAIVKLDKGKILPIDSKFSLENYNRLIEMEGGADRDVIIKRFKQDLKNRIDETAKYIRPNEGTMDFAFMFIPSEAIYYDLLVNKIGATKTASRDLIEYAFRDKHVIIVSPTSFMAYLQTVMQGLRSLQIEEQAREIQERVGMLGRHMNSYEMFLQKLGNSLGTTVNHYNSAYKEFRKVDTDVAKIAQTAPSVEPLLVDKPLQDD